MEMGLETAMQQWRSRWRDGDGDGEQDGEVEKEGDELVRQDDTTWKTPDRKHIR